MLDVNGVLDVQNKICSVYDCEMPATQKVEIEAEYPSGKYQQIMGVCQMHFDSIKSGCRKLSVGYEDK